jgi:MFS family permease
MMMVGRFMSGIGGSYGIALTGPIMADIWPIEQRGKSLGLSMFAPYLGAAVGPLIGGFATQRLTWPWLFWVVSIFDAILLLVSFFVLQESYAPILLERKARQLEKETGRRSLTIYENERQSRQCGTQTDRARILEALRRPFILFIHRPIIVITSFFMAYMFGGYVIALTTVAEIYTTKYHTSIATSSLHYIPVSIGSAGSSLITGYFTDRIFAYFKRRAKDGTTSPEFRVPLMVPGTLLMPIGLVIYGCAAQKTLHWVVTDLGIFIFVFGLMSASQCGNAYLVDEFGGQYASANAAIRFVVNVVGFCFPLFAPDLYARLGYDWGNGLIAAVFVVLGVPLPWVLWKYGERIRQIGKG